MPRPKPSTPNRIPRPEFTQVRKYLELLPGGRALKIKDFATMMDRSVEWVYSVEQGERLQEGDITDHPAIVKLVEFLVSNKLLKPALAREFAQDLSDRQPIAGYLQTVTALRPPYIQEAMLMKGEDDLPLLSRYLADTYMGYEQTRQHVHAALDQGKRVVVYGLGGVGKSTMAAVTAREMVKQGKRVLWLEVGDGDENDIRYELKKALPQKDKLPDALRAANLSLIVLDNIWSASVRALTDQIPTSIPLLMTSRTNLDVLNKERILLDGLEEDDALTLLDHHAHGLRAETLDDAKILCKKLSYHPHSLMIAGKTIEHSMGNLTPLDLLQNLETYIVHGDSGYDATLAALVEQSFHSPQIRPEHRPAVRTAFKAFGMLFAPHAPLPLIQKFGEGRQDLKASVEYYLTAFNMVHVFKNNGLCMMHELLHLVANDQCSEEDRQRGVRICRAYVHELINSTKPTRYQELYVARDNLRGAAEYALQPDEPSEEMQNLFYEMICELGMGGYFDAKGYSVPWLMLLETGAVLAESREDWRSATYLWAKLGNGYVNAMQDLDSAINAYGNSARFAPHIHDTDEAVWREAIMYSVIGTYYSRQNKSTEAQEMFNLAEATAKDNPQALSQIYEQQGIFHAQVIQDYDKAKKLLSAAIGAAERITDERMHWERIFYGYVNLAEVCLEVDNVQNAYEYVLIAKSAADKSGRDDLKVRALYEIGEKSYKNGNLNQAIQFLNEALKLSRDAENSTFIKSISLFMQENNISMLS